MNIPPIDDIVAQTTVSVWDVVLAALTLLVAWIVSIFARRGVIALTQRLNGISDGAAILIARIVRYAVVLTGVGVALVFLGASIQPLVAVALIVAAVVFLALRGVSANFAAGVILQTRNPIRVGDDIEYEGYRGTVRELNGRSVILATRDGRTVHVPNASILDSPIVNHSTSGRGRSELRVRADAGLDGLDALAAAVREAIRSVGAALELPAPRVLLETAEPERLCLVVQFWHAPGADRPVTAAAVVAVANGLREEGITAVVTSEAPDPALTPPPPL